MTEDEYFKIASANRAMQNRKAIVQEPVDKVTEQIVQEAPIEKPKAKRGRPKKQEAVTQEVIQKPIYDISRDDKGKVQVTARQQVEELPKTINIINQEIQNDSIDNKQQIAQLMIKESYEELTRTQIEIEIKMRMYELYNKDIYKKQADQYRSKFNEITNRIRILKELYQ